MKPISQRYESIFDEYYLVKAKKRFSAIYSYSSLFVQEYPSSQQVLAGVDNIKLESFIKSYFLDVIKFKEYHFSVPKGMQPLSGEAQRFVHCEKMLNPSKVGAFTAKWMTKNQPIYMVPVSGVTLEKDVRHEISLAPFILAANVTLRTMGLDISNLPETLYRKLVYHLRFRALDDRSLILYFEALEAFLNEREKI